MAARYLGNSVSSNPLMYELRKVAPWSWAQLSLLEMLES